MLCRRTLLQKNVRGVSILAAIPMPCCLLASQQLSWRGAADPQLPHTWLFPAIRGHAEGPDGQARLQVTCVQGAEPRGWQEGVLAKQFLDCCCPIKTWYQQRKVLRLYLKANEESTFQILALTLFSLPSLAREFGKCQRSPWILQARERFYISPGLTVSADSSHMI